MSVQAGVWNFDGSAADRRLIEEFNAALQQQGRMANRFIAKGRPL